MLYGTLRPKPAFYPSSHSCTSGAAAEILSTVFASDAPGFLATARDIGLSRLYAGIHYRFDIDAGAALGQRVAKRAQERDLSAGGLLGILK